MSSHSLIEHFKPFELSEFSIKTLEIKSQALKGNPLGDPHKRLLPILVPKKPGAYNCVFHLSGFTSNGNKNFNFKSYDRNLVEEVDEWTRAESVSPKVHVFVDAWTSWGGSQFINSAGCGNYEDYIIKEVVPEVREALSLIEYNLNDNVALGGSSGGYGALHLCSKYPDIFQHCLAIAPDCDFEISLKPEIYSAFADIEHQGGVKAFYDKIKNFDVNTSQRSFHTIVNTLAMAACYSKVDGDAMPILPLSAEGVEFDSELWSIWLKRDPIYFLPNRLEGLKKLRTNFLSVGQFDQFLLQYGARKIRKIFKDAGIDFIYEEFKGNHFDIGTRRKKALTLV